MLASHAVAAFALTFGLSLFLGPLCAVLARQLGILDVPNAQRKFHRSPVPLVGGWMLWPAIALATAWVLLQTDYFSGALQPVQVGAWLLGGACLQVGGYLDDKYALRARYTIVAPLVATGVLVASGVGFAKVTNPFGGAVEVLPLVGVLATVAWVLGMTYVTKLLDGADGLAGGVSFLGVATIGALALSSAFFQPDVALLAAVCAGAIAGFLCFNVPPARYYLGEGGSTFLGFTLAFLAVAGGSKAATLALVALIPTVDVACVLVRRAWRGVPLFSADRTHLHHLLLDAGLGKFGVLAVYLATSLLFGVIALVATSLMKIVALTALALVTVVIIITLSTRV
jgi:UDP-GlcNAc:undecaprenyl-phosphate GlcNAc-1-phosphate transferase